MRNMGDDRTGSPAAITCSPDPVSIALLPPKTPRSFAPGAVGLGIVAAMSAASADSNLIAVPPRSEPIMSPRPRGEGWADAGEADEEVELSESYTCVIYHVAGSKRVYFDDGSVGLRHIYGASPGVFLQSPPVMTAAEFINRCYLCAKKLHVLDIFTYRDDKAFCSLACRCQQILRDEYTENCNSKTLKQVEYHTVSPMLLCWSCSSLII